MCVVIHTHIYICIHTFMRVYAHALVLRHWPWLLSMWCNTLQQSCNRHLPYFLYFIIVASNFSYAHTHCSRDWCIHMHICLCICICICIYTRIFTYIQTPLETHDGIPARKIGLVMMYMWICHMHMYMYMYIYKHIHMHTHCNRESCRNSRTKVWLTHEVNINMYKNMHI
jgi:hypothetical protein